MKRFLLIFLAVTLAGCGNETKNTSAGTESSQTTLIQSVTAGNIQAVKNLFKSGADPNKGYPLHAAIESQSPKRSEIVSLLLANGSDPNQINPKGWSPSESLRRAEGASILYGAKPTYKSINREIALLLCKHGAKTDKDFDYLFGMSKNIPLAFPPRVTQLPDNSPTRDDQSEVVLHQQSEPPSPLPQAPRRVLFVGNSYTHALRAVMPALLKSEGQSTTVVEFITPGGAQLIKHLKTPKTVKTIKAGKWDVVVFQEQSQTPACPGPLRKLFEQGATGLNTITDESGARTMLFNTWGYVAGDKRNFPNDTYANMQKRLDLAYSQTANKLDAKLAPVGKAYNQVRLINPQIWAQLYKGDGSHPSATGAYLASIVIYSRLFETNPEKIEFQGTLPSPITSLLKSCAAQALKK